MEGRCDILLFGTMGDIGPVAKSSLQSHGLSVELVDFPQNIFRDEFGYRRTLLKATALLRPSLIIPIGHPLALARVRQELPEHIEAAVESEELIRLLDSKVAFSKLCTELDIRQPFIHTPPYVFEEGTIVFKRDVSFGGHGVYRPKTNAALDQLIAHQRQGEPFLVEDYVEGTDYCVDALRYDGFFRAGVYRVTESQGSGPSRKRVPAALPEIEEIARKIMDHLGYRGICAFDFRVDTNGTPHILECNPRLTGGLATQIESGFDIPYLIWLNRCEK